MTGNGTSASSALSTNTILSNAGNALLSTGLTYEDIAYEMCAFAVGIMLNRKGIEGTVEMLHCGLNVAVGGSSESKTVH